MLQQLLRQAHSVTVVLTCDRLEGPEEDIFAPAPRTAWKLIERSRCCGGIRGSGAYSACCTRYQSPVSGGTPPFRSHPQLMAGILQGIELYRASTPYAEVERCAAQLRRLLVEENCRCREQAVTARNMGVYGPLIDQMFPPVRPSCFSGQMDEMLQKSIFMLITAALDTVAGDYR